MNFLVYFTSFLVLQFHAYESFKNVLIFKKYKQINNLNKLQSVGDPDLSTKWNVLRILQSFYRKFDSIYYPDEVDIPHWTFASPIEWAPFSDTIWFGNAYEYRSAYFHDVMYSNNVPNREGALLYNDPNNALSIALVYQRYKKFDQTSYTTSNLTLFNIFATQSIRIGRFKRPLTNDIILAITDPLTYSDIKRYLNSWNAIKWFVNLYYQQKRKRQSIITLNNSYSSTYLLNTIINDLEYGSINNKLLVTNSINDVITVQTIPTNISIDKIKSFNNNHYLNSQLIEMNSQYYLENVMQSIIHYFSSINITFSNVIIGSDNRILSDIFINHLTRTLLGNKINNIYIPKNLLLSSSQAKAFINNHVDTMAVILSGGSESSNIRTGYSGMSIYYYDTTLSETVSISTNQWIDIIKILNSNKYVNILYHDMITNRENNSFKHSNLKFINPLPLSNIPVKSLNRELVSSLDFIIDCQYCYSISELMKQLFDELELDIINYCINYQFDKDNNIYNNTNPNKFSLPLMKYFNVKNTKSYSIDEYLESIHSSNDTTNSNESSEFGFILNADASDCSVLYQSNYLSKVEIEEIILKPAAKLLNLNSISYDGITIILSTLTLLSHNDNVTFSQLLYNYWTYHGKDYSMEFAISTDYDIYGYFNSFNSNVDSNIPTIDYYIEKLSDNSFLLTNNNMSNTSIDIKILDDRLDCKLNTKLLHDKVNSLNLEEAITPLLMQFIQDFNLTRSDLLVIRKS